MRIRDKKRWERFAQGVATGILIKDAAVAAGYKLSSSSYFYRVARHRDFTNRVKEIEDEQPWGASPDLAPAINMLMRAAEAVLASTKPSAAHLGAAGKMIVEAAKLKRLLPPPEEDFVNYELSREEWLAKYAPPGSN